MGNWFWILFLPIIDWWWKIYTNPVTHFENNFSTKRLPNYRVGFLYEDFSISKLFKKVLKSLKDSLHTKIILLTLNKQNTCTKLQTKHTSILYLLLSVLHYIKYNKDKKVQIINLFGRAISPKGQQNRPHLAIFG